MSLYIASNPTAFSIWSYLTQNSQALTNTEAHLASGLRIMSSADDPVGMAISQNLQAQIGGMNAAQSNVQMMQSMLTTANDALNTTQTTLQSMLALAVQAANGGLSSTQLTQINSELVSYSGSVDFTGKNTVFNGHELLDGGANSVNDGGFNALLFTAMIGANTTEIMTFGINTMTAKALDILSTQLSVDTTAHASQTVANIQFAIGQVSSQQSSLGGNLDVLSSQTSLLQVQSSNLSAANGSIVNLDTAAATAQLANEQLIQQSATAMLAQANQEPATLLMLLGLGASAPAIA